MQSKKIRWKMSLIPGVGAIFVALGAALAICWDDIFHSILEAKLKLTPTSRAYDAWKETPIPLNFDIYFFNWTNPDDINNNSTKPHLVELGPYRFRETRKKVNITWHDENSTVSYRMMRHWYFDEEGSSGSLSDQITTLNVVAASAVYTTRFSYFRQKGVSLGFAMFHEPIAITKTAGELLFDGYNDPLLDLARSLPSIDTKAPPFDKFGWFYERNGSINNDGYFNVGTGVNDFKTFGNVLNWNNGSNTEFYPGNCSKVEGSAGEFYSTKLKKTEKISMFSPDLCRTISFDFDEVSNVSGINGYKYSGGSGIMDNGTIHPENKCYCVGDCQPSGAVNVSTCRNDSPAFISFPHFYQADPYYTDAVEGLMPNKEKHNFYMTLDPVSGIPLDVAARFQLNILMSPSENIPLYSKVPHLFFPVLWFEQRVTLTDKFAEDIKLLHKGPLIGNITSFAIFLIGVCLILWTPISINIKACRWNKSNDEEKANENRTVVLNNMRVQKESKRMLSKRKDDGEPKDISEEEAVTEPLTDVNDLRDVGSNK